MKHDFLTPDRRCKTYAMVCWANLPLLAYAGRNAAPLAKLAGTEEDAPLGSVCACIRDKWKDWDDPTRRYALLLLIEPLQQVRDMLSVRLLGQAQDQRELLILALWDFNTTDLTAMLRRARRKLRGHEGFLGTDFERYLDREEPLRPEMGEMPRNICRLWELCQDVKDALDQAENPDNRSCRRFPQLISRFTRRDLSNMYQLLYEAVIAAPADIWEMLRARRLKQEGKDARPA